MYLEISFKYIICRKNALASLTAVRKYWTLSSEHLKTSEKFPVQLYNLREIFAWYVLREVTVIASVVRKFLAW